MQEPENGTTWRVEGDRRLVIRADEAAYSENERGFHWYQVWEVAKDWWQFSPDPYAFGWAAMDDDRLVKADVDLHDWVVTETAKKAQRRAATPR